jgi:hypothetical protein
VSGSIEPQRIIVRTTGLQFGLQFIAVRPGSPEYVYAV